MLGLSRVFFIPLLFTTTCSQNETPSVDPVAVAPPQAVALVENPSKVGECAERTIAVVSTASGGKLGSRPPKEAAMDPGSYVRYTNKETQVSHEWDRALAHAKVGDRVRMCLIFVPKDCPPGDDRGRVYETTNLRTNEVWKMPDDPHMCGGA